MRGRLCDCLCASDRTIQKKNSKFGNACTF